MNNDFTAQNNNNNSDTSSINAKLKVRALQTAIQILQNTILEPHFSDVHNICSLWKDYPPKLEKTKQPQNDLETVFAEIREKRKDLDFDEYVKRMLS